MTVLDPLAIDLSDLVPDVYDGTDQDDSLVAEVDYRLPTSEEVESYEALMASMSGLSAAHRAVARDRAVSAALLAYKHREAVHYTQGSKRWDGIANHRYSSLGLYPFWADCSAFATWCVFQGLRGFGVRDVCNGASWKAGFTGTLVTHGKKVGSKRMAGDIAIFGTSTHNTKHAAILANATHVFSFGSEVGPLYLPLNYRDDLVAIRRMI